MTTYNIKSIILDSRDRKNLEDDPGYCRFELKFNLNNIKCMELIGFNCPCSMYNVNSSNNLIYFYDGTNKTATLTPGNYDIDALLTEIETAMDNVSSLTFTGTYSYRSMKMTITGSSAYYFTFETNQTNSAGNILGYGNNNTASNAIQVAPYVSNLSIPLYLNISIAEFQNATKSTNEYDNATYTVLTNCNNSEVLTWTPHSFYPLLARCHNNNIQSLNVRIYEYGNKQINFNGANWMMILKPHYSADEN